jgi:hypothetical protein
MIAPVITSVSLAPESVLLREEDVIAQQVKEETVMMSLKTDRYYALDAVGTEVWALLEQPTSLMDLCAALCAVFDVELTICLREVSSLVETLIGEKLVRVVGP